MSEALSDMNIHIPEALAVRSMNAHFSHAYSASTPSSSRSGGGHGGGGGGGFGGGGGGAR